MHGAALLYNLMLAELRHSESRVETYQGELDSWAADIDALRTEISEWDLTAIWTVVHRQGRSLGFHTRAFVQSWVTELRSGGPGAMIAPGSKARRLVEDREFQLKRSRARLSSQRHLELWGGRSGTDRLAYRWSSARTLLEDIFNGLERGGDDAGDA
jgi:hypothetical protein